MGKDSKLGRGGPTKIIAKRVESLTASQIYQRPEKVLTD
jgi:hypothetical protein